MNTSWCKITNHNHEMWISCLNLWLVICSQNLGSTYLLFRWGLYMTCWRTYGLRVTGSEQDTPCHNPLDTLSYSAWNSENTDNWWQLLGAVSHFHYSPGPALTWLTKHKGEWVGFPWHQICGVSRNNIQLPKHPWGVQQCNLIQRGTQGR